MQPLHERYSSPFNYAGVVSLCEVTRCAVLYLVNWYLRLTRSIICVRTPSGRKQRGLEGRCQKTWQLLCCEQLERTGAVSPMASSDAWEWRVHGMYPWSQRIWCSLSTSWTSIQTVRKLLRKESSTVSNPPAMRIIAATAKQHNMRLGVKYFTLPSYNQTINQDTLSLCSEVWLW